MSSGINILRSHYARSLLSGASWSVLGQMSLALSQWGIVVVLARLATPAAVGEFALGMALTAPLFGFSNMCLAQLQATDVAEEQAFGAYAGVRLLSTVAALLVLPLLVMTTSGGLQAMAPALMCGVARAADGASDVCYGAQQRHGRFREIGQSMLLRSVLCMACVLLVLQVSNTGVAAAVGLALSWLLCAMLFDLAAIRRLLESLGRASQWKFQWKWQSIAAIAREGLPLSMVTGLNMVAINLPRYWVERELGAAQLGYFVAVAYLMIAANMVIAAGSQVLVPRLAEDFQRAPRRYCRTVLYLIIAAGLAGVLCLVLAVVAGPQIMTLIYTSRYASLQSTFLWTMAGTWVLMLVAVTGVAMTAARRFRVQVWNSLAAAAATAVACAAFVKPFGLDGAAIAVLIGLAVKLVGQCTVLVTLLPAAWGRAGA
jgi:O-antigen/teichoic acid export membrane protein